MASPAGALATGVPPVRRGIGSPGDLLRHATNPRFAIVGLVFFTYVWRFHELSGVLAPLRLAGLATLGIWAFLLFEPRPERLRAALKLPALPLLLTFILWMGITSPFALNVERSVEDWTSVHFKTAAMVLFVAASASSIENIKRMMALHIIGATVLAGFYVRSGFPLWGSPVTTYDVNDLALHLNMCIPMMLYFIVASKSARVKLVLWLLIGMFAVCILMTQSRGGFLTLGMLSFVTMLRLRAASPFVRILPAVLLLTTYPLLPEATRGRLRTLFSPKSDYNFDGEEGRLKIWRRGMGYMMSSPIAGIGVGNYAEAERVLSPRARELAEVRGYVAHNSFVEVAAETGIPGLLIYVSALGVAVVTTFRLSRELALRKDAWSLDVGAVASALSLTLSCFCVGGFFLSMAHMPMLMTLFAMTAGLRAIANRPPRARVVRGVPPAAPSAPSPA